MERWHRSPQTPCGLSPFGSLRKLQFDNNMVKEDIPALAQSICFFLIGHFVAKNRPTFYYYEEQLNNKGRGYVSLFYGRPD